MSLFCHGRHIRRILVVDDEPEARQSFAFSIEDSGFQPISEEGPLDSLKAFLEMVPAKADAVFSDYRLRPKNYSLYNGDELVAACYQAGIPAVLCTAYKDTDFMLDRQRVRHIPVLLHTSAPNPQDIEAAFQKCVSELEEGLSPGRRPWRTLVRVDEVDQAHRLLYVILPGWNVRERIRLDLDSIPPRIRRLVRPGKRFHAQVNIGAESFSDLYFYDWESE